MKKKVISLVLCLLMALSLIPTAVFAADDVVDDSAAIELQTQENEAVAYIDGSPGGGDHGGNPGGGGGPGGNPGGGGGPGGEYKDPDPATFVATHIDVDFDGTITYNGTKYNTIISNVKASFSGQEYTIEGVRDNERQWHKDFSDGSRPTYNTPVTIKCTATVYDNNGEVFLTKNIEVTYSTVEEFNWAVEHCKTDDGFDFNITAVVQEQIEPVKASLSISKTLASVEAADVTEDLTFTFKVTDEQGIVVADNVQVKVPAGSVSSTASSAQIELEVGKKYTVTETSHPAPSGYTWVSNNIPETVTLDKEGMRLAVTNTYEKNAAPEPEMIEITVTKVWKDNGNKLDLRPGSITVQLMAGDTPCGDSVVINSNGTDRWTHTFIVPETDKNGNDIEYSVREFSVEHYVTSYDPTSFTITNTLKTGTLVINKDLVDTDNAPVYADKEMTFIFDVYARNADITKDAPVLAGVTVTVAAGDMRGRITATLPEGDYVVVERAPVAAPSNYKHLKTVIEYDAPRPSAVANALVTDPEEPAVDTPTSAVIKADMTTTAWVANYYAPYTVSIPISKKIEVATGSNQPASIPNFIFEAYLGDKKVGTLELKDMTKGKDGVYSGNLPVTLTADDLRDHVDQQGKITLTIKEAGSALHWTYDTKTYDISVVFDGDTPILESKNITFTNKYSYKPGPGPKPNPKPTPKPIPSVKTGDMGIALYAMTSLLSLGGAALVIKKRKDEE